MTAKPKAEKPYYLVIDQDRCGMVITGTGEIRGGWLAHSSWLTLFPSKHQAREAITRTRRFARANDLPWINDIRSYLIVPVVLTQSGALVKP